jgi:carboxypeptidase-like protein
LSKRKILNIIIILLFCHDLYAQVEKDTQKLIDIIQQLEQQFHCSFSYADENLDNIFIAVPPDLKSLKEISKYLEENTPLKFTFLENNRIVISPKNYTVSICGYFVDADSNEIIPNVTIQANNKATVSNEQGYFELKNISNRDIIFVKHIKYKSTQYKVNDFVESKCDKIFLDSNIEEIQEIVISNYLTKGIRKASDGSYNINYDNFGILPGLIEPDVLQTILALPGILSVDETVSNINIRGGTNDENLILWDGIKMYQSGHFFGLISAFNPYLTKKVSLMKNGTHANFTDGVSGTILMYSDDELAQKFKAEVGVNLINADAYLDIPIGKKSSVQVSARRSINDLVETSTYKQYFEKAFQNTEVFSKSDRVIISDDKFSFYDVNVKWLYQLSKNDKIRVNLLTFNNNLFFVENTLIRDEEISRENGITQNNLAASVFYDRIWNDKFSTELQVYTSKYNLESTNFNKLGSQRLIQENEVIEGSIKLDTKYILNDNFALFNGYQFVETGVTNIQDVDDPLFRSEIKEVIRLHGLSSQFGYQSNNNNTNARIGVRLNYLEKFDTFIIEPRLSFNQRFLDNFTVEILGEFKHQTTTQVINFQEDFLGIENRRWLLVNNDNIPIIKSKQVSVGLNFSKKEWLISAEGYYKFVDGITSQSQGFQNQYQFVKTTGSYTVFGGDFLINKRFQNLSTWLSYSFAENNYTFEELEEVNFPNNLDIRHSVSLASSYSFKNLKVSAGLNWRTGKPTTKPVEGDEIIGDKINYEPANSSRLADYMRVDISAQYNFNISEKVKAHAGMSVWNILNKENIINNYYILTNRGVDEIIQNSLALTPNVSFRVVF